MLVLLTMLLVCSGTAHTLGVVPAFRLCGMLPTASGRLAVARSTSARAEAVRLAIAEDRIVRTIPASGAPIVVETTVGEVRVQGWERTDVGVDITRSAPSASALERLDVLTEQQDSQIVIRAVQRDGGKDPELRTSVSIRTPRNATFRSIQLFEGNLELRNLDGAVTAVVQRGHIHAVGLAGKIRLEVASGNVSCTDTGVTPDGVIRLRTFNGDVRLHVTKPVEHARVLALTLHGKIASQIPLTRRSKLGPDFGETTIGRGEPVVSIDVVRGDIRIEMKR